MSDLIDRQAAIDALGEKPLVWDDLSDFDLGLAAQWSYDVDAIKALPSAQTEIIRCEDCMHNGSFDTDCPIAWNGKEYCSFAERKEDANRQ